MEDAGIYDAYNLLLWLDANKLVMADDSVAVITWKVIYLYQSI